LEAAMISPRIAAIEHDFDLSVVVPVHNEAENIAELTAEIVAALRGRTAFEVVFVDDGSTDNTAAELARLMTLYPEMRPVSHDRRSGQSIAVSSGVRAARGATIVTVDGDGQNDPKFILELAQALSAGMPETGLVAGRRLGRKTTRFKKLQSRIANTVRRAILRDGTTDTGCGLKAIPRELFLTLPVFDGLHRFLPALVRREGYAVAQIDVIDRDRHHGVSKYGMWNRVWVGLLDLMGVWWLIRRRKMVPKVRELNLDAGGSVADDRDIFAGRVCQ
jgi:glycosyltransferase involved in cell wall biosynthesis